MLDLVSYCSAIQATYVSSGIITHDILAFVCWYFVLLDTGVLNLLEELCIMRVATIIYIYIGLQEHVIIKLQDTGIS